MEAAGDGSAPREPAAKALTIGAACAALRLDFPDITISKVRYLEERGLISPGRTSGGYRLFDTSQVRRLREVLRLQRDEFLPLDVIADRLDRPGALGVAGDADAAEVRERSARKWRQRTVGEVDGDSGTLSYGATVEATGADPKLIHELEDFGLLAPRKGRGEREFDRAEVDILKAAVRLSEFGVRGKNLRTFRSAVDNEVSLLKQIVAPLLRAGNPQRRREARATLDSLARTISELEHLLLVRELRALTRSLEGEA